MGSSRMRTVNAPLTSVDGRDKHLRSRVTDTEYAPTPMRTNNNKADEVISLPSVAHDGCCFLALELGEVVDSCPCLVGLEM